MPDSKINPWSETEKGKAYHKAYRKVYQKAYYLRRKQEKLTK